VFLKDADELKNIFKIDELADKYIEYIPLIDKKVGFSIKRKYPDNIRFKPPTTKDNEPDTLAIIHVYYFHPDENTDEIQSNNVPLFISIGTHSKYLGNPLYDFNDDKCPTKESIEKSKKSCKPISLEVTGYTYDHSINSLKDKDESLSGEQILDKLFQEHCNTVHIFKGFKIQWQINSQKISVEIIRSLIKFLTKILWIICGYQFEPKNSMSGIFTYYKREDLKKVETNNINLFGYQASKHVIISFCFFVLMLVALSPALNLKLLFFENFIANGLAIICASYCSIWFLEYILPIFIYWLINGLISLKLYIFSRAFRKAK